MTSARFSSTRPSGGSVRSRMAMATAWLGAAWVAGYLLIIYQQVATELDTPMTVFLATFVGVMAALAFGAAVSSVATIGGRRRCCTRRREAPCRRVFSGSRQLACR